MDGLRIRQAIDFFNENRKAVEPKMNQTTLGELVLPELDRKAAGWYISQWSGGKQEGKLKPKHIYRIWQETGVTLYFLFGIDEEKS